MSRKNLSITFLYPSKRVGGAQLLFVRLAIELSKFPDVIVNVVDYKDGFLESSLANYSKINILHYHNGSVVIDEATIVVTPLTNLSDLTHLIKGNFVSIKFLFWAIHSSGINYLMKANFRKFFLNPDNLKSFFKEISDKGNLVYMDEANYLAIKNFNPTCGPPSYMPIPVTHFDVTPSLISNKSDLINLAWLGRISYDKVYSVIKIIDEIRNYKGKYKIVFHIIGNGEKYDILEKHLKNSGISYILVGTLEGSEIYNYIKTHIQIGVAMGTSCLELASFRLPTFLIDYGVSEFPLNIKYNWMFETVNYNLGSHIDSCELRNHNFSEIISQFKSDLSLGDRCYDYVLANHGIDNVALKFKNHLNKIDFISKDQIENIQTLFNPSIFNYFFSKYRKLRGF
jgi:hypothetical protein